MRRSVPSVVSDWLLELHTSNGVCCLLDVAVTDYASRDARIVLNLHDGRQIEGTVCLVGVGNRPNVDLTVDAGLEVKNGIIVNEQGCTLDPTIFAAGDVANFWCFLAQHRMRRESWANAPNQAIATAKNALGLNVPYRDIPWLWSDQYDCNIQILGILERAVRHLTRGQPRRGAGSWLALDAADRVLGIVSINRPQHLRTVRKAFMGSPFDLEAWMQDFPVGDRLIS